MKRAAKILKDQKDKILDVWEKAVKEEVIAAKFTSKLALRNHLPFLLDDIIKIMQRLEDSEVIRDTDHYEEVYEHSLEHGRQRSSLSGYTVEQILREYIVFHRISTEILMKEFVYTTKVGIILNYSLENAMLYSVSAFDNSLQEMREKLIGIVAHDMRNPISAAYIAVGAIKSDMEKERLELIKKMIESSLKRSLDLIEGLLDSITVQAGSGMIMDFSEINLAEEITSVHQEANQIYSNEIRLESNEEEILGVFDGVMIRRVLENFLSNAVKYGEWDKPITILVENSQESVSIRVHNYGEPIPEEKQQEIFQFLSTTNGDKIRNLRSYGMGLYLVRAVAEGHGGNMKLNSDKREGTTFSIVLKKYENKPGKKRVALNFS